MAAAGTVNEPVRLAVGLLPLLAVAWEALTLAPVSQRRAVDTVRRCAQCCSTAAASLFDSGGVDPSTRGQMVISLLPG